MRETGNFCRLIVTYIFPEKTIENDSFVTVPRFFLFRACRARRRKVSETTRSALRAVKRTTSFAANEFPLPQMNLCRFTIPM